MSNTSSRPSGRKSSMRGGNRHRNNSRPGGGFKKRSSGGYRGGGNKRRGSGGFSRGRRSGGRKMPTFDPSQFINKNPVELKEEVYTPKHTFATFGLNEKIVKTLANMGITIPTPIQDQTIASALEGRDVIGLAETGTGKTAAFLIPLIQKTLEDDTRQALILAPTRELAIQINDELRKITKGMGIFSTVCVGGMNIRPQIKNLYRKNHFVIGTPGRIMDLMRQEHFKPFMINAVVLDEADRMLDMGFINDMRTILSATPEDRETLFFSATMNKAAKELTAEFQKDPVVVSVKKRDVANSIEQDVVYYEHAHKFDTLVELFDDKETFSRVIVFGAMKHSVQKLSQELSSHGITAEAIHGNKSHVQRQRALKKFKDARVRVLVATDVAARGIHVDDVSHVINYDLPNTFEDYVHRIGRTGRGKKRGKALTFVAKRTGKPVRNKNFKK